MSGMNENFSHPRRIIPVSKFNDFHPDPTVPALRWYIFTNKDNFLECVIRRGRRVLIDEEKYFLSFHEIAIPTKTLNLFPLVLDVTIEILLDTESSYSEEVEVYRVDSWYLVLTVWDSNLEDCLEPNHKFRTRL